MKKHASVQMHTCYNMQVYIVRDVVKSEDIRKKYFTI